MKKFTKHILMALVTILLPAAAWAQQTDPNDIVPGFLGHPLLSENGYKAIPGSFDLELLGGGSMTDGLDPLTDMDPDNYAQTTNLIGATVAYDEIIRVISDGTGKPLEPGKQVGFVVADASNSVNILGLDVISMFAINFLDKSGKIVATKVSNGDATLDILNLSLVSVANGKQKIVAPVPEGITDDNGDPVEVYGVSLSGAGVNASVGHNVRIFYAFIDDFEMVPIIKKYYPRATGEVAGMATGGGNLVNNDLTDGAATAILTIGGSYYTVKTNSSTPFPKGVEAGWVMSSGSVLALELGGAMQVVALDKDDNEYILSTSVGVVGLDLIGGGNTTISFMTPREGELDANGKVIPDIYGFKLKRINVLDLDLGATRVHYAYIKVPEYLVPSTDAKFDAGLEAVPGCSVKDAKNAFGTVTTGYWYSENDYTNTLYLTNSETKPLLAPNNIKDAEEKAAIWGKRSFADESVQLLLYSRQVKVNGYDNPTVKGRFDIRVNNNGKIQWRYKKGAIDLSDDANWSELGTDADGTLHLYEMSFDDEKENAHFEYEDGKHSNTTINYSYRNKNLDLIGFEYELYFVRPGTEAMDIKESNFNEYLDRDQIVQLDYSSVNLPIYQPQYELAGPHVYISDIYNNEIDGNPNTSVKAGEYKHYMSWTIPDNIDNKTKVKSVTLRKYNVTGTVRTLNRTVLQTYTASEKEIVNSEGMTVKTTEWTGSNGNDYFMGFVNLNGTSKIVMCLEDVNADNDYGLLVTLELRDDYLTDLAKELHCDKSDITKNRSLDFLGNYTSAKNDAPNYTLPALVSDNISKNPYDDKIEMHSTWTVNLNSATEPHLAPLESYFSHEQYQDLVDNVNIAYTEWTTITNAITPGLRTMSTLDGTTGQPELNIEFDGLEGDEYTDLLAQEYNGSRDDESASHTIVTCATYPADIIGEQTQFTSKTRAYLPLVPSGFETKGLSDNVQTYMVLEAQRTESIANTGLSGVENVVVAGEGESYEYYNVQGIKVENPESGVYLRRAADGTVTKVLVK